MSRIASALDGIKHTPFVAHLEVTLRCNFRCEFCYNGVRPMTEISELPLAEIHRFIDEFVELGGLALNISGGEPTLRRDFCDIWQYAAESGLKLGLETNGSNLSDEILEVLRRYPPVSLRVSLYASSEAGYRTATGALGMHRRVKTGVERLIRAGLVPEVRTPLTCHNFRDICAVAEWCDEIGVQYVVDPKLWPGQDGRRLDHLRVNSDDLRNGVSPLLDDVKAELSHIERDAPSPKRCDFGISELYLGADGYLHFCHTLWGHRFPWRKSSLRVAWEEWYPAYRDRSTGGCAGWHVLEESAGACPWGCIYANETLNPRSLVIRPLAR